MTSYEDQAKPWQHWTLSYLNPLLRLGAQKVLDIDDCGTPSHEDSADVVHAKVIQAWDVEVERARLANIALAECRSRRSNSERGGGGGNRLWGCFGRIFWRRHSGADATATATAAHTNQGAVAVDDGGEKSSSTILTPGGDSIQQQLGPESTRPNEPKVINPSLSRALLKSFGPWRIVYAIVLISVSSVLSFVPILLLNDLVRYAESVNNSDAIDAGNAPSYKGIANPWIEVAGLFFVPLFASILQTRHMVIMQHAAVFARTGCSTMLFQKALRVSPTGRSRTDVGLVVNMMSNDTTVIMKFVQLSGMTAVTPLQIGISLALIHRQVGTVSTWVGVAFLVLLLPFNGVVFSTVARLRRRVLKFQDARVKMTNDVLAGIRIVKFYAWERPFGEEIEAVREEELKALTSLTLVMLVGFSAILFAAPIVQIMLVFATFTLTQEAPLSASVAFTTVALFNMLRFPFAILPMGLMQLIQAQIGLNRMMRYLSLPELDKYVIDGEHPSWSEDGEDDEGIMGAGSITMTGCSFAWTDGSADSNKPLFEDVDAKRKGGRRRRSSSTAAKRGNGVSRGSFSTARGSSRLLVDDESKTSSSVGDPFVLSDISCSIKPGTLTAIVGSVGSGKSSLLSAMLGEMEARDGSKVYIPRGDATRLRNEDDGNYTSFCSQTPWVVNATLQDNIVFGRKFDRTRYDRVVAACALNEDIAILPAQDKTEIGERGVGLSGGQKARVCLARALYEPTTSLVFLDDPLSAVDSRVGEHLFDNAISGELTNRTTRVLVTHHTQFLHRCDWIIMMEEGRIKHQGTYDELLENGVRFADANGNQSVVNARENPEISISADNKQGPSIKQAVAIKEDGKSHALISEEGREEGSVANQVYRLYIRSGTVFLAVLFTLFQAGSKGFEVLSSFWLAKWADDTVASEASQDPLSDGETMRYLGIYCVFGLLGIVCLVARGYALVYHRLRSSRKIHANMLQSILRAPINFFDVTPLGRILNRFAHDMDKIDLELGHMMSQGANILFAVIGAIGAMAAATKGTFLIVLVPLGYIYWKIQIWFRLTSTELGRLFNVSKSPIFADFSQMLTGVSVVRAFGEQERRFTKVRLDFDENNLVYLLQYILFHWIALRLDVIGGMISLFVAAIAVGTTTTNVSIPAGWLGLALTYSIEIVTYLKHMVRMFANLESCMSSVERVLEFSKDITPEAPESIPGDPADDKWPSEGRIVVENISMRYRDGPLVLKSLSFTVGSGEKIGVVGRTGSGKSSLMIALLRIVEIEKDGGKISIDGIDISTLGTSALRLGISIIPQDAILFANTVRYNVDPFGKKNDEEIWGALEKVQLANVIAVMPNGLDEQVAEGGENFSQGQRQLICIARSVLRKPKILIMDEATASIDSATDSGIQTMVRENFANATILTIAHRLHTIVDSDRILVLDDGKVAEFDTPSALLASNGIYAAMVRKE